MQVRFSFHLLSVANFILGLLNIEWTVCRHLTRRPVQCAEAVHPLKKFADGSWSMQRLSSTDGIFAQAMSHPEYSRDSLFFHHPPPTISFKLHVFANARTFKVFRTEVYVPERRTRERNRIHKLTRLALRVSSSSLSFTPPR